jgi:hypothetical protein
VDFAVLFAGRVAQIHRANQNLTPIQKKIPKVGTTRPNRPERLLKPLAHRVPIRSRIKTVPILRKLG